MDFETIKALLGAGGLTVLSAVGTYGYKLVDRMLTDRKDERAAELKFRQEEAQHKREERAEVRADRRIEREARRRDALEARKLEAESARDEREERRQFIVAAFGMRDSLASQSKVLDALALEIRAESANTSDLPRIVVSERPSRPPSERRGR